MQIKRYLILGILFVGSLKTAYAQSDFRPGYIITNDSDTVEGFIKYREGDKAFTQCDFKSNLEADETVYSPSSIKAYRFINDKLFISEQLDSIQQVFLEVIVNGPVSFYRFQDVLFLKKSDPTLYELKNSEQVVEADGREFFRENNEYRGILNYLLNDCPAVSSKVNTVSLSEQAITKLVERYNACKGSESVIYKQDKKWFSIRTGIALGLNSSFIKFKSDNDRFDYLTEGFDVSHSLIGGIQFDITSPKLNESISFYLGFFYHNVEYTSTSRFEDPSEIVSNDVSIELENLKIPIGIRYRLPGRLKPIVGLGVSSTRHLSSSSSLIRQRDLLFIDRTIIERRQALAEIRSNEWGYWASFGLEKSMNEGVSMFAELRLEATRGINEPEFQSVNSPAIDNVVSSVNNIQLLVGVAF